MEVLEQEIVTEKTEEVASVRPNFGYAAISSLPLWALLDTIWAIAAVKCAHILSPAFTGDVDRYDPTAVAFGYAIALVICVLSVGLYSRQSFNNGVKLLTLSITANAFAVVGLTLAFSWLFYVQIGRYILGITFLLSASATALSRWVVRMMARSRKIRVMFIGRRSRFDNLAESLSHSFSDLYAAPLYLELRDHSAPSVAEIMRASGGSLADEIVVEDNPALVVDLLAKSADLIRRGAVIRNLSSFHEELFREMPLDPDACRTLLASGSGVGRPATEFLKRMFDLILSTTGLILASPLLLIVALVVKISSRGPIFYRQTRVGRFGVPFKIIKFRTMNLDAERDGPQWARRNDHRVTFIGGFLRRTRIDEIPQLWNILLGQMSFVGPRPERPEFVEQLELTIPFYGLRHLVAPGLTGWAQVQFHYGGTVDDSRRKLSYDLYYVRHYGVIFDLAIFVRTIWSVTSGSR